MIHYNKYLKYKKKYLELKGGVIYYDDETLDDKELTIITDEYDSTTDIILTQYKEINPNIISCINTNYILNLIIDPNFIHWSNDTDTLYINTGTNLYFNDRFKFILYSINKEYCNINENFIVNEIPNVAPYEFTLTGIIFGQPINLFNAMYHNDIMNIVYDNIITWIRRKIPASATPYYIDTCYKHHKQIFFNPIDLLNSQLRDRCKSTIDHTFKIHMNVKLENFFYVLNTLILNHVVFSRYLYAYKIVIDFQSFRINNQFSNRDSCCTKEKNGYIVEETQVMNFVFYPKKDDTYYHPSEKIQGNIKIIIDLLKSLFPDELNVASNIYPRYNFKINNTIYFSSGDGVEKWNHPELYEAPTDYDRCGIQRNEDECNNANRMTKTLSNHELCKYNNETNICENRNVNQQNLLIRKIQGTPSKTSRDIYKYIGQEDIYEYLISL